jgi:hypothetical protein
VKAIQCKYPSKEWPEHAADQLCFFNCTDVSCENGRKKNVTCPWSEMKLRKPIQQPQPQVVVAEGFHKRWEYDDYSPGTDVQIPGAPVTRSEPMDIPKPQNTGITQLLRQQGLKKQRVESDAEAQLEWLGNEVKEMERKHIKEINDIVADHTQELRSVNDKHDQEIRELTETVRKCTDQLLLIKKNQARLEALVAQKTKGKEKEEEESEADEVEYPLTQRG